MGFFAQAAGPTRSVLNKLFADQDLAVEITYKRYVGSSFNSTTKVTELTYTDIPLTVLRLSHTVSSQLVGTDGVQVGDQLYLINGPDIPTGMSMRDKIVDENNNEQDIKQITPIFGLATAVTIRGMQ